MGGKLDLSQIRSPRMARRVAKNANDEGIEGPPKSALESKPTPAPNTANLFIQPQVAIPVFPTNIPVQSSVNRTPSTPPGNRIQPGSKFIHFFNLILYSIIFGIFKMSVFFLTQRVNVNIYNIYIYQQLFIVSAPEKQPESPKAVTKAETKVIPTIAVQPNTPESTPSTPTQVTLTKAPTPWMQNKNKPQEELPEWAKRSSVNKQSSVESPTSPPVSSSLIQQPQPQPQWQQAQQQRQQPVQQRPQSLPQIQQRPVQIQQQSQQYQQYQQPQAQPQFNQQQKRPFSGPPVTQQASPQTQHQERVIPIRVSVNFFKI